MTDQPTLLDRMTDAGINRERAEALIRAGAITVDDVTITDPGTPAPTPSRITQRPT